MLEEALLDKYARILLRVSIVNGQLELIFFSTEVCVWVDFQRSLDGRYAIVKIASVHVERAEIGVGRVFTWRKLIFPQDCFDRLVVVAKLFIRYGKIVLGPKIPWLALQKRLHSDYALLVEILGMPLVAARQNLGHAWQPAAFVTNRVVIPHARGDRNNDKCDGRGRDNQTPLHSGRHTPMLLTEIGNCSNYFATPMIASITRKWHVLPASTIECQRSWALNHPGQMCGRLVT